MKKLILVFALIVGLTGSASAALINIGAAPGVELNMYTIYNTLYSSSYASNAALGLAQENDVAIWFGLFSSTSGNISARARYAGATVTLDSYDGILGPSTSSNIVTNYPSGMWIDTTLPFDTYSLVNSNLFGIQGKAFGFPTYYSESWRNPDSSYRFLVLNTPDPNKLLIGFEDGTDGDYNDFVFETLNVRPVPEPTTMVLLGMGALGLFGFKKRKAA